MDGFSQGDFNYIKNLRIVVDTNFLIHVYLNPSGYAATVLRYIKENHTLILSDYILDETLRTTEKIARKYNFPKRDLDVWKLYLPYIADEMIILPDNYFEYNNQKIRDIYDIGIIVTARLSRSQLLISNDKDLVHNEAIQKELKILRLDDFEEYIKKQVTQEERDLLERLVKKYSMEKNQDSIDAT